MSPRATYRLQLHKGFGFDDAAALAPYLARLGISHVYCSPYFKARPDSTHGYDVVDHNAFNPELGGEQGFRRMSAAFAAHGLQQIADFVPNHVGVGGADNPAWLDVLEWGEASAFAGWFDIDWRPDREDLRGKVLVPILGEQYGAALDAGQLVLKFDAETGELAVWAYDAHKLPVCPLDYSRVLGDLHPDLERLGDGFSTLPEWRPQVRQRADELKTALAALARDRADVAEAIQGRLARFNAPDSDGDRARLDALIQVQHWRPAHFRVAADDINYRRFFNINDLAGVRVELSETFDHMHRLLLALVDEGVVDGVRIDHVDGLLDPKAYLERLRGKIGPDRYLVVEKILAGHEALREDWPVDGTTGYDFANLVTGLLVDPAGEEALTRIYRDFTGERQPFETLARDCKLRIMDGEMASELHRLARSLAGLARQNPRTADFTQNLLRRALRQVIASFPVYRTYVDERTGADAQEPLRFHPLIPAEAGTQAFSGSGCDVGQPDCTGSNLGPRFRGDERFKSEPEATSKRGQAQDRRDLDWAVGHARRAEPELEPSVFDFLHRLLSGDLVAQPHSGYSRHGALSLAMKVQQYSGPVMAKGLEDTAFYRFNRLLALNEVGGEPDRFGVSVSAFHRANQLRAERWPAAMLAGSTHDTKRGEDARARLVALSAMPDAWEKLVMRSSRLLRARRGDAADDAPPDRNDEYLFYQMLVGAWPVELLGDSQMDRDALTGFSERIQAALVKSMREAKTRTTWAAPDTAYEAAMLDFAALALDPERSAAFLGLFRPFVQTAARLGARNSLVQTVLRLTAPGVPDLYQGSELLDLSLVDPDNRRPVDFKGHAARLARLEGAPVPALEENGLDGGLGGDAKLAAIAAVLDLRRRAPGLFAEGSYEPVAVSGEAAEGVCAFLRRAGPAWMLVVAERLAGRRQDSAPGALTFDLPEGAPGGPLYDVLRRQSLTLGEADAWLANLPVAVLVPSENFALQ